EDRVTPIVLIAAGLELGGATQDFFHGAAWEVDVRAASHVSARLTGRFQGYLHDDVPCDASSTGGQLDWTLGPRLDLCEEGRVPPCCCSYRSEVESLRRDGSCRRHAGPRGRRRRAAGDLHAA